MQGGLALHDGCLSRTDETVEGKGVKGLRKVGIVSRRLKINFVVSDGPLVVAPLLLQARQL